MFWGTLSQLPGQRIDSENVGRQIGRPFSSNPDGQTRFPNFWLKRGF
jgi:hypothetical protein